MNYGQREIFSPVSDASVWFWTENATCTFFTFKFRVLRIFENNIRWLEDEADLTRLDCVVAETVDANIAAWGGDRDGRAEGLPHPWRERGGHGGHHGWPYPSPRRGRPLSHHVPRCVQGYTLWPIRYVCFCLFVCVCLSICLSVCFLLRTKFWSMAQCDLLGMCICLSLFCKVLFVRSVLIICDLEIEKFKRLLESNIFHTCSW